MKELDTPPREEKENQVDGKGIILQDYPCPHEEKRSDLNPECARAGLRQSELSVQVDSKAVVDQILLFPYHLEMF
jgi:hypothetical protein